MVGTISERLYLLPHSNELERMQCWCLAHMSASVGRRKFQAPGVDDNREPRVCASVKLVYFSEMNFNCDILESRKLDRVLVRLRLQM